jgi:transcription-repair coupling factor (superfamily II helicase)
VVLSDEAAERALPLLETALEAQVAHLREEGRETEAVRLQEHISRVRDGLRQRTYARGLEYFLPYLYPEFTTLLDYVPDESVIVIEEPSRLAEEYSTTSTICTR